MESKTKTDCWDAILHVAFSTCYTWLMALVCLPKAWLWKLPESTTLPDSWNSQIPDVLLYFISSFVLASFESQLSSSNLFPELSLSFVFATHGSPILVLRNLGQQRQWVAQHIHWGKSPILLQVLYLGPISFLLGFQLQVFSVYNYPSWITA